MRHGPKHVQVNASRRIAAAFLSLSLMFGVSAASAQVTDPGASEQPSSDALPQPADDQPPATEAPSEADPETEAAEAPARPWTVVCSEPENDEPVTCQLAQTIVNSQTRQRVVTVSIRKQPGGLSMVLALPHGLHIPGGVTYQVDSGQARPLPIMVSDDKGVYAIAPVDDALFTSMKRGATFKVSVMALNRRPISIPMTLTGFTAAAEELAGVN